MTDFERINGPRVEKIKDMIAVIEKSARSNKVRPDEIHSLMKPVFHALLVTTGKVPEAPPVASQDPREGAPSRPSKPHYWNDVRAMAEEASLSDLTYAMAVYINRLDDHLKGT